MLVWLVVAVRRCISYSVPTKTRHLDLQNHSHSHPNRGRNSDCRSFYAGTRSTSHRQYPCHSTHQRVVALEQKNDRLCLLVGWCTLHCSFGLAHMHPCSHGSSLLRRQRKVTNLASWTRANRVVAFQPNKEKVASGVLDGIPGQSLIWT